MNYELTLSPHFTLEEMVRSSTAQKRGINNTATCSVISNLQNLCQEVLEPLRQWHGKPIVVTSGYRSPALNKAVGGVSNSQHMKGEAADIRPTLTGADGNALTDAQHNALIDQLFEHIRKHLPFDQLIKERETSSSTRYWIHVSCKRNLSQNRKQVIKGLVKTKG